MNTETQPTDLPGIDYGIVENTSDNFRTVVHFLAALTAYAQMPLFRLMDIDHALRQRRVLCARQQSQLAGLAVWANLPDDRALEAIQNRVMPTRDLLADDGQAVVLLALGTRVEGLAAHLSRRLFAMHTGRLVIYERGEQSGSIPGSRFIWLDRRGERLGMALSADGAAVH